MGTTPWPPATWPPDPPPPIEAPAGCWPTAPVVAHLQVRLGAPTADGSGYTYENAAVVVGVSRPSFDRYVRRGWVTDRLADRIANELNVPHTRLWPSWNDIELTPDDEAWLASWLAGAA